MENWPENNKDLSGRRYIKDIFKSFAIILVVLALGVGVSFAKPLPEFEKMKSLVGEWRGTSIDKKPAMISYTLVSDNSALMERLTVDGESEMVTMYYPDGDHLMMTHYCSAHNQPRMRSQTVSGEIKSISFDFVDATNLSSPDAGHMEKLLVTFADRDHFTQEWTWTQKGREKAEVINLERMK